MAIRHTNLDQQMLRLRFFNRAVGILHLLQAVGLGAALFFIEEQVLYPVTRPYSPAPDSSRAEDGLSELFMVNLGLGLVLVLAISAFFHLMIPTRFFFDRYARGLRLNRNNFRWAEYLFTASALVFFASLMSGISDVVSLVTIVALTLTMVAFGALQEKYEQPGSRGFLPFSLASIFGLVPWIIIGTGFSASTSSSETVQIFASQAVATLFLFFLAFAFNQFFQFQRVGRWKDYIRGETVFILLSLLSKTVLVYLLADAVVVPLFM